MASIKRFEQIEAWKKARELAGMIYDCSNCGPLKRDFGLRDQIRRASVSVMSNIAEGFGRGGNKEFVHYLTIARGSVSEVQSQLYVAKDTGQITEEQFSDLYTRATDTRRLITGFINYLKNSGYNGPKNKAPC